MIGVGVGTGFLLNPAAAVAAGISASSYDSVSFSVSGQEGSPTGIAFNSDGTKMFVVGYASDAVYQYSLSTGYDLSTASYDSVSFSVSAQDGNPHSLAFNSDGTKMFILGGANDSIFQYSLSTGFDLSTASYGSVSLSVSAQDTVPFGLTFNSDGTKMFLSGSQNDSIYQYSLSTGYDLSTASYDSVSFSVSGEEASPWEVAFNSDGTKMYMVGNVSDAVHQYSLSTGFDLSTASYDSLSFSVSGEEASPLTLAFSADGAKMFILGLINKTVYQYSTSS